jgi:putative ABC transport system permease protein
MTPRYERSPAWLRLAIEAARGLAANRRRSIAVAASLACGVCALCLIGGYYEYTYWGLAQSLIRSEYGHIELYQRGYLAERDLDPFAKPIDRADELLVLLRSDPDIEAAASRQLAFASARNPATGATAVVEVRGVVPEDETAIFTFMTSKRGPLLVSRDSGLCQIAPTLAKELGLGLGDRLVASAVDARNSHNAMPLRVKTLIGSYTADFDALSLNVPRRTFADLFGFEGSQEIAILLKDGVGAERKLAELERDLGSRGFDLEYRLWYEQAEYFRQVLSYFQGFYRVVLLMSAILAFFVCAATTGIALNERMREFGTKLGVGESRGRLVAGLAVESFLSGLAGLAAGALLSLAAAWAINASGGIAMGAAPGMATSLRVMLMFSPRGAIMSVAVSLLAPLLALALPARKVLRKSVVVLLAKGRE